MRRKMGITAAAGAYLLLLSLVLTGCSGRAQPPACGSLDGYVYTTTGGARSLGVRGLEEDILDQTADPFPEAVVSIDGRTAVTDGAGYFFIDSIRAGTYTVSISAAGYQTLSIPGVAITRDRTTHLEYRYVSPARKSWNFLVYMDGDNDLEDYAIADLNEMEKIGSTDQVNILVLIDRALGYDDSNADWTTTRLYYVTRDANITDPSAIRSTLLAALGERDMSDPATLRDFIVYCQRHFPADGTCLTLWNHGGGVFPKSMRPPGKSGAGAGSILCGICWDDTSTQPYPWNCLTTDEVAQALAEAENLTGRRIDVINMDLCLTQMIEVAYEWRDGTRYLAGSEGDVPGTGNDYAGVLAGLAANPWMDAEELAKTLVDGYHAYYDSRNMDTTYSCIDLGAPFAALVEAFSRFARALHTTTDPAAPYLAWRYFTTRFNVYFPENIDLYRFADELSRLSEDQAVVDAAAALKTAIAGAVYHRDSGWYEGRASGIAVMLPGYSAWSRYSGPDQYASLDLSAATEWEDFILDFVAFTEGPPSTADDLTVSITWPAGDCDLYVYDHDGYYDVSGGSSPNGTFGPDRTNGGTETWTLNQPHLPTLFEMWVGDHDYDGYLHCSVHTTGPFSRRPYPWRRITIISSTGTWSSGRSGPRPSRAAGSPSGRKRGSEVRAAYLSPPQN